MTFPFCTSIKIFDVQCYSCLIILRENIYINVPLFDHDIITLCFSVSCLQCKMESIDKTLKKIVLLCTYHQGYKNGGFLMDLELVIVLCISSEVCPGELSIH